jgi:hypothetical protein
VKFEIVDIDHLPDPRRRRLVLGLPTGLVLSTPLALIACGGGGDSSSGSGGTAADPDQAAAEAIAAKLPAVNRSVQAAKVVLPTAIAAGLTGSRLVSANNVSAVADNGNAGVVAIEGAPQMSYVYDGNGKLVLMSVIEAGVRTTVDSRGTAEALLLLTSEAGHWGPAIEIAMRRALADARFDSIVEPVRLAVEAAAGRNGIDPDDAALMDALKAATLALRGKSAVAPMRSGRAKAQAVTVTPDGTESGITVLPTADFNTVEFQNQFRRRTWISVARTGSYDAMGNFTLAQPPEAALPPFALDATAALSFDSLVTSVGDYVTQFYADLGWLGEYESSPAVWQPVKSGAVALPFAPDTATVAEFTARVVGVGANSGGEKTADEQIAWENILWKTMIEDIVKPFIRTVILPMISDKISGTFKPEFEQASWSLVLNGIVDISNLAVAGTYFPATVAALKAGDAKAAFGGFLTEFFSSNTLQGLVALGLKSYTQASGKNLTPTITDSKGNLIGVNLVAGDLSQFNLGQLKDALGKLARIIQAIKVGTLVGDYGAIVNDWAISSQLTQFTLKISKAKVSLSPSPLVVSPVAGTAGKGSVTAKVEGLDGGVTAENVWLQWKCTAKYGDLFRVGGDGVNDFETLLTSPTHDYIPSGVEDDPAVPDTVTVTAFYRNPTTNAKVEMGSAKVSVQFKSEFTLNISPKGSVDLPTDIDFPLDGFFNEKLPATATVEWTWTHGGAGSLVQATTPTTGGHQIVTLKTGASDGTATITLSAIVTVPASDPSGARTVKVKPVSATFKVKKGTRTVTFECGGGVFPCDAGCGVSEYTAFIVPRIAGALSYSGTFSGFSYPSCNRSLTWNSEVGDGGGCSFPVTYHPRSAGTAAPAWAVWIGFGGPLTEGKFVATITLPA